MARLYETSRVVWRQAGASDRVPPLNRALRRAGVAKAEWAAQD